MNESFFGQAEQALAALGFTGEAEEFMREVVGRVDDNSHIETVAEEFLGTIKKFVLGKASARIEQQERRKARNAANAMNGYLADMFE